MIALLVALGATAPTPAELKTFKDWIVGCDNGDLCQADGVMPQDNFDAATIAVRREAEAGAQPEIWIRVSDGKPADVAADGKPLHLHLTLRDQDYGEAYSVAVADSPRLASALTSAKSLSVIDSNGQSIAPISLNGSTAALLYMDDRQHRVGTVTALVRKGAAQASAIPAPPTLPTIPSPSGANQAPAKLTAAEVHKIRSENDACGDDQSKEQNPEYDRLDANSTLALIPEECASGAYNYAFAAVIVGNDGKYRDAEFDDAKLEGDDGTFNAEWDPKARTLLTGMKGRGIGDCGGWSTYTWDGQRFRLIKLDVMDDCRGSIDFITTWRAKALERR
jgi:hypothetical protein